MAKLILRDGGTGKEFDLEKTGSLTIGRSPDCDITIDDTQASRRHCSVVRLQSGYEVNDLGSTNGTLVNSTLVKRQKLKHGDVIRIGAVEVAFDDPSSAGAGAEPAVGYLVYAKGDKKGQKVELAGQRTTIGRKPTNTVVLDDPVCSSYHCEIVRGLNGYTIRDLGSTNGTLLNSEMVTEAQIAHGARIRVGNTRFVFQDPAMAEIDLDLAGAADEDEWGMMRDLDLAAVRKRNPATIVYALLFLAIVGTGGYFLAFAKPPKAIEAGPVGPQGNLHLPYSFESEGAALSWRGEPDMAVTLGTTTQVHGAGSRALEIRANVASAAAFYGSRLGGERAIYRIKGMVAARGAKARLGLLWLGGGGLRSWSTAPLVDSASLKAVELAASAPPWASSALLGVSIEGAGTVFLDDVSLVAEGAAPVQEVALNGFRLVITDGRAADLFHSDAAYLVNGRGFARDAQGNEIDAPGLRLKVEEQDKEHMLVTVEGAGEAATAGLVMEEVSGYLSWGGFRAFTPSMETRFHPSFPDDGVLALKDVRKLLLGPSGRSFAVVPGADGGPLDAEARVEGKRRTVALTGPVADGRFAFRFKVDLRGETKQAMDAMAEALALHAQKQWGDFLVKAAQALAEFPFANKATRDQLRKLMDDVNADYEARRKRTDRLLEDYKRFKSLEDLGAARADLAELQRIFQIVAGEGPRGEYMAKAQGEVNQLYLEAREQVESRMAEHSFIQARLVNLQEEPPADYSAALQLFYVYTFLPHAKQAVEARQEFDNLAKKHPHVAEVLEKLGFGKR